MKNIFNLNSTSTGLNAFSRASKGDSQDARKGSTLTKMAAVICTFSCFQGGQKDKEGLKCKAKWEKDVDASCYLHLLLSPKRTKC